MTINNALAGVAVKDFASAVVWYERLLNRPADSQPMEGLAEWQFDKGGWLQLFKDAGRAGSSSVTLAVEKLNKQLIELKEKGISVEQTSSSEVTNVAVVTDPDGNQIIFSEVLSDTMAS